jgi:RimJ/RimL family protein N-acetyltransferase
LQIFAAEFWLGLIKMTVTLREVREEDLPVFFEQQLDAEARRMAVFPGRDREHFMAHWAKSDGTAILNTIVADAKVAGNIVYWEEAGERKVGYWLGRAHWGKGIASAALAQFLPKIKVRPVYARVAKHNLASIRVLQKCGFQITGEDTYCGVDGAVGEELIMQLRSDDGTTVGSDPPKT